jgi:hypothetical protein
MGHEVREKPETCSKQNQSEVYFLFGTMLNGGSTTSLDNFVNSIGGDR